jgi:hypothetical protein
MNTFAPDAAILAIALETLTPIRIHEQRIGTVTKSRSLDNTRDNQPDQRCSRKAEREP